jgi:hypothetical protein
LCEFLPLQIRALCFISPSGIISMASILAFASILASDCKQVKIPALHEEEWLTSPWQNPICKTHFRQRANNFLNFYKEYWEGAELRIHSKRGRKKRQTIYTFNKTNVRNYNGIPFHLSN